MRTIFVIAALTISLLCIPHFVSGGQQGLDEVVQAIRILRPQVSVERAQRLARYIKHHADEAGIDPLLITAIVFRESSFLRSIETGRRRGRPPQKCVGLMQIYPGGAAHKLGGYCDLTDIDCNIQTGVMWLEYLQDTCGDTHWQWVASYGMRDCPSYEEARRNSSAIAARTFYCRIRRNCEEHWPRQENSWGSE